MDVEELYDKCETSNNNINDHFPEFRKPIVGGKGNVQNVIDYHLSRYACYLIVQNANPRKKIEKTDSLCVKQNIMKNVRFLKGSD